MRKRVANLSVASSRLRSWFRDLGAPPVIEADRAREVTQGKAAALFLSGGVDSTASLAELTERFEIDHPHRPKFGILLNYQSTGRVSEAELEARFLARRRICSALASDRDLELITIRTNIRCLEKRGNIWIRRWHGAVLASAAHALGGSINYAHIAATYDYQTLDTWGSHPELDPYYSSRGVKINHHGFEHTRLEKMRLITQWPLALDRISVCTSATSGGVNCEQCEKCLRTRVQLLACDALERCGAFKKNDVEAEEVRRIKIKSDYARQCFLQAIEPLQKRGRDDLVEAIRFAVSPWRRRTPHVIRKTRRLIGQVKRQLLTNDKLDPDVPKN